MWTALGDGLLYLVLSGVAGLATASLLAFLGAEGEGGYSSSFVVATLLVVFVMFVSGYWSVAFGTVIFFVITVALFVGVQSLFAKTRR
jgi:hypothetical protein